MQLQIDVSSATCIVAQALTISHSLAEEREGALLMPADDHKTLGPDPLVAREKSAREARATLAPDDSSAGSSATEDDLGEVVGPLLKYSLDLASPELPKAPIQLPDSDALTVRLVPIHQLQRFDELRDDASLWQSIAWTAVGGVIGFLTSILTQQTAPSDPASYVVLGLLGVVAIGAGFKSFAISRRLAELRKTLFDA